MNSRNRISFFCLLYLFIPSISFSLASNVVNKDSLLLSFSEKYTNINTFSFSYINTLFYNCNQCPPNILDSASMFVSGQKIWMKGIDYEMVQNGKYYLYIDNINKSIKVNIANRKTIKAYQDMQFSTSAILFMLYQNDSIYAEKTTNDDFYLTIWSYAKQTHSVLLLDKELNVKNITTYFDDGGEYKKQIIQYTQMDLSKLKDEGIWNIEKYIEKKGKGQYIPTSLYKDYDIIINNE